MEIGGRLAQAELDVAQLVAGALQLGSDPFQRSDRALRERDEVRGSVAVVGGERCDGRGGPGGELGDVAVPLAFGPQLLLRARLQALGVLDDRVQLREPGLGERRVGGQLLLPAAGGLELAPRRSRRGAAGELLLAAEAVEHLELVRGSRQPPLLELARHRDHALDRRGDVLPRRGTTPGVGARPSVGEDPAGDDERVLVLRPQLTELLELRREIELRLDVGLVAGRADVASRRPSRRAGGRAPGRGSSCRRPSPR